MAEWEDVREKPVRRGQQLPALTEGGREGGRKEGRKEGGKEGRIKIANMFLFCLGRAEIFKLCDQ